MLIVYYFYNMRMSYKSFLGPEGNIGISRLWKCEIVNTLNVTRVYIFIFNTSNDFDKYSRGVIYQNERTSPTCQFGNGKWNEFICITVEI